MRPLPVRHCERAAMNEIWIVRHGETEWSAAGRHTSRTDIPLTEQGRIAAAGLAPVLGAQAFALVLVSPRTRALQTAAVAGFADAEVDDDLREWDYGDLEGKTSAEIEGRGREFDGWTIWQGPVPGGETIEEVAARTGRVIARADAACGDVLCFGHGHASRVLAAVSLDLDPRAGARLLLDPATIGVLGSEHNVRALRTWNTKVV